jgi:hypothetical protein
VPPVRDSNSVEDGAVIQPLLFVPPKPPDLRDRGIDLRCCSCDDPAFVEEAAGARLLITDPPWSFVQKLGRSRAENHYRCLSHTTIVRQMNALRCGRMAMWLTGPTEAAFDAAVEAARQRDEWRWGRHTTSGAWVKSGDGAVSWDEEENDEGHYGLGHVWAGCSEPVRIYTIASHAVVHRDSPLRNAWIEPPRKHSQKPVLWMVQWILRWTEPGDLVVDPYAGLGSVAEAVLRAGGRRYLGAEIDPTRHGDALALLAQVRA